MQQHCKNTMRIIRKNTMYTTCKNAVCIILEDTWNIENVTIFSLSNIYLIILPYLSNIYLSNICLSNLSNIYHIVMYKTIV